MRRRAAAQPPTSLPARLRCARWLVPVALLLPALGACDSDKAVDSRVQVDAVTVQLRYSGPRYAGTFYTSFLPATDCAVWVETASGRLVETLMITPTAVSVGAYSHLDHLPAWQARSGVTYADLEAQTSSGVAPAFDGLTRASVLLAADRRDTTLTLDWDVAGAAERLGDDRQLRFCAEVANIVKNSAAAYDIVAESTCGAFSLDALEVTAGEATEHILELTAVLRQAAAP